MGFGILDEHFYSEHPGLVKCPCPRSEAGVGWSIRSFQPKPFWDSCLSSVSVIIHLIDHLTIVLIRDIIISPCVDLEVCLTAIAALSLD